MPVEARHAPPAAPDDLLADVRFLESELYGADVFDLGEVRLEAAGENLSRHVDGDYIDAENLEQNFSLPADMKFGEANVYSIVMYSILMVVGLTANSISLYHLIRSVNTAYRPSDRRRSMFLSI